ncbi:MAG: DUF5662 family protein [Cyanobacteria bacterium P01_F01_bin.13]
MTEKLAQNLKAFRESMRLTQQQVADEVGLDRTAVVKIEANSRQVSPGELIQFADLFGKTPNTLLGVADETDALRKTYDHISLVQKLLASAQIELMRRQFTHDQSKLKEPEWSMFAKVTHRLAGMTYGSDEYKACLKEMLDGPLGHHYEHNRHHPEHHSNGIEGMNLFDVLEMFIDWCAAVQRHDDGDIYRSIELNTERFGLSDQLARIFENTASWVTDEFIGLDTQKDLMEPDLLFFERSPLTPFAAALTEAAEEAE